MSRLTLRLPESLHQQLSHQASQEGISLNQYIVYALTRQITQQYLFKPVLPEDIEKQQASFLSLLNNLDTATSEDIQLALEEREIVASEDELTPDTVAQFQQKIKTNS
ncbi:toxin-antitoxin system HicB family antitoxin [Synechocystis salina LEGE 06155]|nr:toxin-antitoxin system HicB family antitoxin [Synechocystis salina LEGE 06155]